MTMGMEIHDCVLRELHCGEDGRGHALFRAPIYRSEGQVFEDAQESGWQDIRFDFEGMNIEGSVDFQDKHHASDGELWVDGKNENGVMLLPASHKGNICLEMRLSPSFDWLKIRASNISSELIGDFEIEAVWDAEGNITSVL